MGKACTMIKKSSENHKSKKPCGYCTYYSRFAGEVENHGKAMQAEIQRLNLTIQKLRKENAAARKYVEDMQQHHIALKARHQEELHHLQEKYELEIMNIVSEFDWTHLASFQPDFICGDCGENRKSDYIFDGCEQCGYDLPECTCFKDHM